MELEQTQRWLRYKTIKTKRWLKTLPKKAKKYIKYDLVDATAMLTSTNPLYSISEVFIAGMPKKVYMNSRLTIAAISYTFMSPVFVWGGVILENFLK